MNQVYEIRDDWAFKDGERTCPICNDSLPAHHVWPGARYRYCLKSACKQQVLAEEPDGWQYVESGEHKCCVEHCSNFIPEGRYSKYVAKSCNAACYLSHANAGNPVRRCACGCGQEVRRNPRTGRSDDLVFVSLKHACQYRRHKYLTANTGAFRPLMDEYLSGFAEIRYRDLNTVRCSVAPFLRFLNEHGSLSLEAVTPKVITQFIGWRTAGRLIQVRVSYIKTFLDWAIQMGYREQANPVITSVHNHRRKKGAPRPYSSKEMAFIWTLLAERGNPRVRFVIAIAEETGLRLGEICRLRVEDIDTTTQRCFVRLPNKTNCERYAFFGSKTKKCFEAWMKERDIECGHDALLHNKRLNPCRKLMLIREMNCILCKAYEGRTKNEIGLERWSVHRLRHTMASNLVSGGADMKTVMANGGWKNYDAACGYAAPDLRVARRGYHDAMRRVQAKKKGPRTTRTLTPAELLACKPKRLVKEQLVEVQHDERTGAIEKIGADV